MKIADYLTVDEQILAKTAYQVPVSAAILKAARIKVQELQRQAVEKAGSIDPRELENLLVRAQGLQWLLDLPEKIRRVSGTEGI